MDLIKKKKKINEMSPFPYFFSEKKESIGSNDQVRKIIYTSSQYHGVVGISMQVKLERVQFL